MTHKMSFCLKAATTLNAHDLDGLTKAIEAYDKQGVPMRQAEQLAVADLLAGIKAERGELFGLLREQHPDLFARPSTKEQDAKLDGESGRAEENKADYTGGYETDLFGEPIRPQAKRGSDRAAGSGAVWVSGDTHAGSALRDTEAPEGNYRIRTLVGQAGQRKLGSAVINSAAEAAAATRYLYRSAVERMDALVTDVKGKPLAIIGNFKGALSQTSVYPATLVAEAVRIPGAANVWFSHNHPSGESKLSRADQMLYANLANVFQGSGIEPRGILAIGDGGYSFEDADTSESGEIPSAKAEVTVPIVERELVGSTQGEVIDSPSVAKRLAMDAYKDAKGPGMLLLNAQHRIAAWIPLSIEMRGPLRGTGGLNAIYRAVSESNAGAVILAHGGELDQKGLFVDESVTLGQNIAAALQNMDVRVLDSINADTGESAVEHGQKLEAGPVFSLSSGIEPGAVGVDVNGSTVTKSDVSNLVRVIAAHWRGVGLDNIVAVDSPLELPHEIVLAATGGRTGPQALENLRQIEGVTHKGKVYLVAENLPNLAAAETTLFHEALGHLGIGAVLGNRTPKTLASLWDRLGGEAGIQKMAEATTLSPGKSVWDAMQPYLTDLEGVPDSTSRRATIVDEFLAFTAQRNDQSETSGFKEYLSDLKASVAAFARKLGLDKLAERLEKMTGMDVAAFVSKARKAITDGKTKDGERFRVVHNNDHGPAFSLSRGFNAESLSVDGSTSNEPSDNVSYARSTDPQANALISEVEKRFVARRPGFVLHAVEAPRDRSDLRAARALARGIFGHQVIFVEQPSGQVFNGLTFDGPKASYVLLDVRSPKPVLSVLGHELLHRLKATNPKAYDLLNARLSTLLKRESAYARQLNDKLNRKSIPTLDKAETREELIADIVGDEFAQPEFWQAMANEEPSTFRRIANTVIKFLDDVLAKVTKTRPFGTDQYVRDIKAARVAVAKAMTQLATSPKETKPDGSVGAVKLSVDPTTRDALAKAGLGKPKTLASRFKDAYGSAMDLLRDRQRMADEFQQGALDQFTGIKRAIEREIGNLPVEQDPYIAARLANGGTSSVMRGLMLHGKAKWADNHQHLEKVEGSKGLLDILKPLGDDLNNWFGWMIGNRAARLMAEGRENNFTADEVKALQALNNGKQDLFRQAAKEYADFKRSVLDVAEGAGLLDAEARKVWDHADYIPFYRQIDERASFSPTGRKGLAGQSSGVRTLKGGAGALNDPMENLLMNFSRLIDASLKNNALLRTVDILGEAENQVLEKVGYDMSGALVPTAQIRQVLANNGLPDQVLNMMPPEIFDGMAKMWAIKAPSDPDVIRVMRDGKPEFYRVHDPLLLKAITSFVPFDFVGLGVARAFKRVLTAAVTATPEFMLRNFVRDAVASQMIARDGFNPAGALKGMVNSYRETASGEAQLFAGASFQSGNVNAADPSATGKAMRRALRQRGLSAESVSSFLGSVLDKGHRGWEHYREIGEAVENANRDMVHNAAMNSGKSATAAAFESKDLMDFNLRGSSPVYQVLADVLPFFNARVQGMYRLGRTDKRRLLAYGMAVMALSLLLGAANDGQDWYDELPDWDKDGFWHIKVGGKHFRIPKPFELGVAFATIPERIGRYVKGLDAGSKAGERLWANVRDQLAVDVVPQIIRPGINAWANKDTFRDSPIEGMADEGKLPHMRYSANTSATAKALLEQTAPATDQLGLSPKKLEYLVNGYFGTVGSYALGLSDLVVKQLSGAPRGPAMRLDDVPVVKAFYREDPARGTVFESDLYKMREEAEKVYRSINAARKDGQQAEAKAMEDKDRSLLQARSTLAGAARTLASLNKRRDQILSSETMSPEDKRQGLDNLQQIRNRIARQAMTSKVVRTSQ